MKKQLFLLMVASMFSFHLQAQLSLTQSNTAFTPGSVSVVAGSLTNFTLPTIGVNQVWNYSNLGWGAMTNWSVLSPANVNFPTATYVDTSMTSTVIPGRYFYYDVYNQALPAGVNSLGFVLKSQHYYIGDLTGGTNDSCVFPAQYFGYIAAQPVMPFPTTMGSSWHSNTRSVFNFNLTIAAYTLNNVPCQKVSYNDRLDTVVAWGKMRVATAGGQSIAYDVLMVKRMSLTTDSFFMNGSLAPPALLTAFGLTQGQTTIMNRYLFWRADARYPLLMVNFGANNFTTAASLWTDGTAQFDASGINEISDNVEINLYPNPSNGNFSIHLSKQLKHPIEFTMYNIYGQKVYSEQFIPNTSNYYQIQKEGLSSGSYFVKIVSGQTNLSSKIIIQ